MQMRHWQRSGAAAWSVVAGAGVGACAALLLFLDPGRRGRTAAAAREAGRRAIHAARTSRRTAEEALHRGAAHARELSASARRAGEKAAGRAKRLRGEAGARVREAQGQLEAFGERSPRGRGADLTTATVLLGRALLGKGLLRVPFGLAGLAAVAQTGPVRRGASAAAHAARSASAKLRAQRERAGAPRASGDDAFHPSVPGVGEVRDPLEAAERQLLTEAPRSDSPEEEGGPGLQATDAEPSPGNGAWRAADHDAEEDSAPLVADPQAVLPDADDAPRIEAPGERPVSRTEPEGSGRHVEVK
jgi:hypothetical protein